MSIIAVCVLAICGVLLSMYIGETNKLFSRIILLVLMVLAFFMILEKMEVLLSIVEIIEEIAGLDRTYMKMLLKMTGIIFVAEFTADICEEQGAKVVGKQVLLCGRLSVLMIGYPLLLEFVEIMRKFLT